jgi:DNA-binding LacI/PurR family transcriptional regulator
VPHHVRGKAGECDRARGAGEHGAVGDDTDLSHATVSFVLNGHAAKHKISAATQQRVREAAERYHCVPNQQARNLRMRRSGMIGVVLPTLTMDWAAALMRGLNRVLDPTDHVPFVTAHEFDASRNRKELQSALHRRDDGLIAFPLPDSADLYHSIQRFRRAADTAGRGNTGHGGYQHGAVGFGGGRRRR